MPIDLYSAAVRDQMLGKELGCSQWYVIDQQRIDAFGRASDDIDPMHMDPEWTGRHSPYGTTIAYGFQTLSLLTHLLHDVIIRSPREAYKLNYGLDRVRMLAPVKVGSKVRAKVVLKSTRERGPGQILCNFDISVEIQGEQKPALVAEWLLLFVEQTERAAVAASV
ncbi:MaoC/PaaZ C-terminal domain-containing protein [Peristeroidobacter agariperforans]|uniref:MaoC/PaaZ C-terminal domain-containing protein n=1 Tax=Peristeroidobacter agariperforans TaxID=268404 RepID=UPI0013002CC8|nr:MaoC/PaaZ C-terminal domain-containing protein [Peristeroidobacter agariperforans]